MHTFHCPVSPCCRLNSPISSTRLLIYSSFSSSPFRSILISIPMLLNPFIHPAHIPCLVILSYLCLSMGFLYGLFIPAPFFQLFMYVRVFKIQTYICFQIPLIPFYCQYIICTPLPYCLHDCCLCPHSSIVTTCPFICILSSTLGIAVISLLFSFTACCPKRYPSSLLHAETMWHGFMFFLLLERIVFPSTQIIFFSFSPSLLASITPAI